MSQGLGDGRCKESGGSKARYHFQNQHDFSTLTEGFRFIRGIALQDEAEDLALVKYSAMVMLDVRTWWEVWDVQS